MTRHELRDEIQRNRLPCTAKFDPQFARFQHDLVGRRTVGPYGQDVVQDIGEEAGQGDAGDAAEGSERDDEDEAWFGEGVIPAEEGKGENLAGCL